MQIYNFIPSFIDYPGKTAAIAFLSGCNYRCPACHSKHLVESSKGKSEEEFFDYLKKNGKFLDGIVVCGGEPTIQKGLPDFLKKIRQNNLSVKLDTNGSNPQILSELLRANLVDYLAMDIKAPKELYNFAAGKEVELSKIEESMRIASRFPDYEFRTTIVPVYSNGSPKFMSPRNIKDIASWILHTAGKLGSKYFLQRFVPRENGLIDSALEKFPKTPDELMHEMKDRASKYLYKTEIRN